jgi:hypothetical protein
MRRITRRIGLFGGPGAIVRAAGAGKGKRLTDAGVPDPKAESLTGVDGTSPGPPPRKSWFHWFGGRKSKP